MVIDLSKKPLSQLEVDVLNGVLMGMSYEQYKRCQSSLARKRKKRTRKARLKNGREELSPEEWDIYDIVERIYK